MRVIVGLSLILFPTALWAQPSPCTAGAPDRLGFDPYKPSHLAVIRSYGSAAFAQLPLEVLLKLDPYSPTEAALLRQMGGAIPYWAYAGYGWYAPLMAHGSPLSPCETAAEQTPPSSLTFSEVLSLLEQRRGTTAQRPAGTARAEPARGVSIQYDGRVWLSAGPAVPFSETAFVRVGERAGSPIFREIGKDDGVIYIPTAPGMVAPFQTAR